MNDGGERQMVERWRAQRMSFQSIAACLGRPIDAVRSQYDPTYQRLHIPQKSVVTKRAAKPMSARVPRTSRTAKLVQMLYDARVPVSADQIPFDTKGPVGNVRLMLGHEAVTWSGKGWSLTAEGRRGAERIYGCGQ